MQSFLNSVKRFWMRPEYEPLINDDTDSESEIQVSIEIRSAINFIIDILRNTEQFKELHLVKFRKYLYIALMKRN